MVRAIQGFDWDEANRAKCEKHGVSRADIEAMLAGDPAIAPDWAHSHQEQRYIAAGRSPEGRALFVAFTYRERAGQLLIRPVSARYMHAKEASRYEQDGP